MMKDLNPPDHNGPAAAALASRDEAFRLSGGM